MDYKKITKKKLIDLYEELVEENNELIKIHSQTLEDNDNLKQENINLNINLLKKLEDFIDEGNKDVIDYLKKRIEMTQGDKQKHYKKLLKKYLN